MSDKPSYYAIIPANVRYSQDLEMGAKLLYGEITSLTHLEGYCWASNQYFADLYAVDVSTIKRWINSLKSNEFIFIETDKNGINWQRKIWISREAQKQVTKAQKRATPGSKMSPPRLKNEPHNKKTNTKEDKKLPLPPKGEAPIGAEKESSSLPPSPPAPVPAPVPPAAPSPEPSPAPANQPIAFTSQVDQTYDAMTQEMQAVDPDYVVPNSSVKHIKTHIDYMLSLDLIKSEAIIKVFRWGLRDDFWCPLMFSTNPAKALRKHFYELQKRMERANKSPAKGLGAKHTNFNKKSEDDCEENAKKLLEKMRKK